ncbi:MAG: hypothetical protein ABDH61_02555 [Acidilobaceae archaeon]
MPRRCWDQQGRFSQLYWNSCTSCGPRFAMIYDIPYDGVLGYQGVPPLRGVRTNYHGILRT